MAEFQDRIRFNPVVTTNSMAVLKYFARSNMGITLLPAFVVAREIDDQQLIAIKINHDVLASGEAHMITRLGRQLSIGSFQLLQHLTAWMRAFS